jgi:gluconate 2-dehydrogenase subunit 3-like protein
VTSQLSYERSSGLSLSFPYIRTNPTYPIVPRLSRRSFLSWLAGLTAAVGFGARPRTVLGSGTRPVRTLRENDDTVAPVLDVVALSKIADVVLPSDLGADGHARIARAFNGWIGDFRPHAELVHPYGNPTLRYTPDSPALRWRQQLATLDKTARSQHGRSFVALSSAQRDAIIRSSIATERLDRMRDPLGANHVVVALIAYYFTSPDAADLCYEAQIGRNQCRPLVTSSREPVALKRRGRA